MHVWITKVSSSNYNTCVRVILHANACITTRSVNFTHMEITRTLHVPCTHLTCSVHEYYMQTTRILRMCRCYNPFDQNCLWPYQVIIKIALWCKLTVLKRHNDDDDDCKNHFLVNLSGWPSQPGRILHFSSLTMRVRGLKYFPSLSGITLMQWAQTISQSAKRYM